MIFKNKNLQQVEVVPIQEAVAMSLDGKNEIYAKEVVIRIGSDIIKESKMGKTSIDFDLTIFQYINDMVIQKIVNKLTSGGYTVIHDKTYIRINWGV